MNHWVKLLKEPEPWARCKWGQPTFKRQLITFKNPSVIDTHVLHTHGSELVAGLNTLIDALSEHESTSEATSESITSTVGVDDLLFLQGVNSELLGFIW